MFNANAECKDSKPDVEPLIKIEALAEATGISRFKWYRLAHDGTIPTYRCGRALRFKLSEILEWMKGQRDEEAE